MPDKPMTEALREAARHAVRLALKVRAFRDGLRGQSMAGRVPSGIWRRLPAPQRFDITLPSEASVDYECGPGDLLSRALYWRGVAEIEPEVMWYFLLFAQRASHVLDIGANTGLYALVAAASNADAQVVAFEPLPRIHDLLVKNVRLNRLESRVACEQAACSDVEGTALFLDPGRPLPYSARLVGSSYRDGESGHQRIEVPTISIDDYRRKVGRQVDLVKIDVEGAEDLVLRGMRTTMVEDRPIVFLECFREARVAEVNAAIPLDQYEVYRLGARGPHLMSSVVADPSRRDRNFLLIPKP